MNYAKLFLSNEHQESGGLGEKTVCGVTIQYVTNSCLWKCFSTVARKMLQKEAKSMNALPEEFKLT